MTLTEEHEVIGPVRFEVMAPSDREDWVVVVMRWRASDGAEFLPIVAEFHEDYESLAEEMASRLNVRAMAAGHLLDAS